MAVGFLFDLRGLKSLDQTGAVPKLYRTVYQSLGVLFRNRITQAWQVHPIDDVSALVIS